MKISPGLEMSDRIETPPEDSPVCYYVPFETRTVLTEQHPYISLGNVNTNSNNYYISYEIVIDGVPMKNESGSVFTTGAIPPGREVRINLFKELGEGAYQLQAVATDYDFAVLSDLIENEENICRPVNGL